MRLAGVGLVLVLLAGPLIARAQPAGKVARIGVLSAGAPPAAHEAYGQALRQLGYVEGQNLLLKVRYGEGRVERFPELAAELVRTGVDVLVTSSQPGAMALKRATATIPIVLFGVSDPVGAGLVQSLAPPGGNVTGVAWEATPEEAGKRLQLLKEAVPTVSRVALLWRRQGATDVGYETAWQAAAGALGVQLQIPVLFVDRILKGAKPADLPVEQPTKYKLVINLKAAKALRLTIPPLADHVIE